MILLWFSKIIDRLRGAVTCLSFPELLVTMCRVSNERDEGIQKSTSLFAGKMKHVSVKE